MLYKLLKKWSACAVLTLALAMFGFSTGCQEASAPEDAPDWEDIEGYDADGRPSEPPPGSQPNAN